MRTLDLLKKPVARQTLSLYLVNVLGLPLSIVTSIIVTRYLGAFEYGNFKFINSVFNFAILLCSFGLFHAGNRALVLSEDSQQSKEIYSSLLVVFCALSIIMTIGVALFAYLDANVAQKGLTKILICVSPCGSVYLMMNMLETVLPADRQIRLISIERLVPKVGYLIGALLVWKLWTETDVNRVVLILLIFVVSQLLVYVPIIISLRPSFSNLKRRLSELLNYNKTYGFDVYVGSLCAVGFATLTDILISYFSNDNVGVGYYSLALTFANPLLFVPITIATTRYKDFSVAEKISYKTLKITVLLSVLSLFALWIVVPPFIKYFYGTEFMPVVKLNFLVSIGVIFHGLSDFFNKFIGAKGKGKLLRNASFLVGFSTLAYNLLLIPKFGATGAAFAKILSGFSYFIIILICYKKTIAKQL